LFEESQILPAPVEIVALDTVAKRGAGGPPFPGEWFPHQNTNSLCGFDLAGTMPPIQRVFVKSGNGGDRKRADFRAKQNGTGPGFSEWRIRAAVYRTGRRVVGSKVPDADVIVG